MIHGGFGTRFTVWIACDVGTMWERGIQGPWGLMIDTNDGLEQQLTGKSATQQILEDWK